MKHFIITNFNEQYSKIPNPNIGIDKTWLEKRLKIFKEITIPSVENQTDKDFTWILKCHTDTPSWAREILVGNFITCYDQLSRTESFSTIIRRITNDKEIITTALDSDDAMSRKHIETVKKYIKPNKFFDFSRGLVKTKKGIFVHYKPIVSQFFSYMSNSEKVVVTYHRLHSNIAVQQCIVNQTDLGWMQNNHDSNIMNGRNETKEYEFKATEVDYDTIKDAFPFINISWL